MDDRDAVLRWLRDEYARPFAGWDFGQLTGRMAEEALPWDYRRLVADAQPTARTMLDIGTGGGEFLASLRPLPVVTCATEGCAPNVPIARACLEPLGVRVVAVADDARLPFADEAFDLIVNRHGSYDPPEIRRLLQPGGRFVTQQVGATNLLDLNRWLGAPAGDGGGWNLGAARRGLEQAGLRVVTSDEAFPATRFRDVGAIVLYLKAIPWQIPGFDIDRAAGRLLALHQQAEADGGLVALAHRFLVVAERPADPPCARRGNGARRRRDTRSAAVPGTAALRFGQPWVRTYCR